MRETVLRVLFDLLAQVSEVAQRRFRERWPTDSDPSSMYEYSTRIKSGAVDETTWAHPPD